MSEPTAESYTTGTSEIKKTPCFSKSDRRSQFQYPGYGASLPSGRPFSNSGRRCRGCVSMVRSVRAGFAEGQDLKKDPRAPSHGASGDGYIASTRRATGFIASDNGGNHKPLSRDVRSRNWRPSKQTAPGLRKLSFIPPRRTE